jgi:hypothetical protein
VLFLCSPSFSGSLPWAMLFLWCLFNLFLHWFLCCSSQRSWTLP